MKVNYLEGLAPFMTQGFPDWASRIAKFSLAKTVVDYLDKDVGDMNHSGIC